MRISPLILSSDSSVKLKNIYTSIIERRLNECIVYVGPLIAIYVNEEENEEEKVDAKDPMAP